MPLGVILYNANNAVGDMSAIVAYNPAILWEAPRATRDLWRFLRSHENIDPGDIDATMKGAVMGSNLSVQELPEINRESLEWQYLTGQQVSIPKALVRGYIKWAGDLTQLRENILRLAARRWFLKQLQAGKKLYGASNPAEIDEVMRTRGVEATADKLARELLIDYGSLSPAGQWLRRFLYPFWSWVEGNAPRYVRMLRNLPLEGRGGRTRVVGAVAAGATTKLAVTGGVWALRVMVVAGLMQLWNRFLWPDEEEDLRDLNQRNHLVLGRTKDGTVRYVNLTDASVTR